MICNEINIETFTQTVVGLPDSSNLLYYSHVLTTKYSLASKLSLNINHDNHKYRKKLFDILQRSKVAKFHSQSKKRKFSYEHKYATLLN